MGQEDFEQAEETPSPPGEETTNYQTIGHLHSIQDNNRMSKPAQLKPKLPGWLNATTFERLCFLYCHKNGNNQSQSSVKEDAIDTLVISK